MSQYFYFYFIFLGLFSSTQLLHNTLHAYRSLLNINSLFSLLSLFFFLLLFFFFFFLISFYLNFLLSNNHFSQLWCAQLLVSNMSLEIPLKQVNTHSQETSHTADTSTPPSTAGKTTADVDIEKENTNDAHIDPTLARHAHDEDDAMKAVDQMGGEVVEIDEPTNKRLLKTIDRHLMPIMCMVYAMNFLDSMLCYALTCLVSSETN